MTIGGGIENIDESAFANCSELTDVYCYATTVPSTSSNAFDGSYIEYATLHVPEEAIDSYKAMEPWSRFMTFVSVTDDNEFYEMTVSVAGSHGTVAYGSSSVTNGTQTFSVKEGTDVVLTVTPDEGYQLTSLTVNGTERKGDVSGGSLTLSSITGDITVVAKFGAAGNAQQITIGASGMATFCSDSDLDFSTVSGLQAYTGAGFNRETGVLTMLRVSDVPAGTGLVLRGTPGTYEVPYGTSASIYANLLVGVTTATTLSQTEGELLQAPIIDIPDVVDPVGVGDAFMGGFLHAIHAFPGDRQQQLNYSLAAAALKNTIPGDFNLATDAEIMDVVNQRHNPSTLYKTFE